MKALSWTLRAAVLVEVFLLVFQWGVLTMDLIMFPIFCLQIRGATRIQPPLGLKIIFLDPNYYIIKSQIKIFIYNNNLKTYNIKIMLSIFKFVRLIHKSVRLVHKIVHGMATRGVQIFENIGVGVGVSEIGVDSTS
ncbi:hypothetical protein I3760_09G209300 [Carya illinoinensis]|nr:hypothetical protein I3760_09G209300 [Carya illinoinensis]